MNAKHAKLIAAGAVVAFVGWKYHQAKDALVPADWAFKQILKGHPFWSSSELIDAWNTYLAGERARINAQRVAAGLPPITSSNGAALTSGGGFVPVNLPLVNTKKLLALV